MDANSLVGALIYLVVLGLIFYVCFWGLGRIGLPEPFAKIATVVLVLVAVIVLLNLLFGFVGQPFIRWGR